MNPKQRRGLLLLALSLVGAVAVFALVASYVGSVSSQVGPTSTVFVAQRAIAPRQAVTAADVVAEQVPTRYVTPATILDRDDFLGHKSIEGISQGTWLQRDLVEPASSVADGEREVSVNFDAAQGIDGRVRPGDLVDVVGAFAARQDGGAGDPSVRRAQIPDNTAGVLVRDARVVSVGTADQGAADAAATVAVTFSVPLEQAVRLSYGEAFAVSLRIVRSGNNETGAEVRPGDLSFDDAQLPDALSPPPPAPRPSAPPAPEPDAPAPDEGGNP